MSWVRQATPSPPEHVCVPPTVERFITLPPPPPTSGGPDPTTEQKWTRASMGHYPDGVAGDLWRCDDCGTLWRIVQPAERPTAGYCPPSKPEWLPARWWQRLRYRRVGVFDAEQDALRRELAEEST